MRLKQKISNLWQRLIITGCVLGFLLLIKLGYGAWRTAVSAGEGGGEPWLWWLMLGACVLGAIFLLWEACRRWRLLGRKPLQ